MTLSTRGGLRDITNCRMETNGEQDQIWEDLSGKHQPAAPVGGKVARRSIGQIARDHMDFGDPQQVTEYAVDIYNFLSAKEQSAEMRVHRGFLDGAAEVSGRMRGILLDWLIEVHYKFKLLPETLYLCVNLIDRFLQKDKCIPKRRLQLMGGTCMLVAAKYEEYRPPEVRDICYIMDNAYQKEDVLEMEVQVLNTLQFSLTTASPLQFLEFFAKGFCGRDSELHYLAQFCLECSIIDAEMTTYLPSQLACVALFTASRVMYPDNHNKMHEMPGPYDKELMLRMESELVKVITAQKDKALGKKYAKDRYKNVMSYVRKFELGATAGGEISGQ
ncbi:unnamed protein product [Amoebophrya sp. A25]|nr:unnamed protein product [Amoebophrya sp. A25]|eukprot:GSA25T00011338001.1